MFNSIFRTLGIIVCLIGVLFNCQTKSVKTREKKANASQPYPVLQVQASKGIDTMTVLLHYGLPGNEYFLTDTIQFNEEGKAIIPNVMGPFPMQYAFEVAHHYYGLVFLEQGLLIDLQLDTMLKYADYRATLLPKGISFKGADAEKTQMLNLYADFEHPFKDSLRSLFDHIRYKRDRTSTQRISSTQLYFKLLSDLVLDTFNQNHKTPNAHWLLQKKYTNMSAWFFLSLAEDSAWYKHFVREQLPAFTGFGGGEQQFYQYHWRGALRMFQPEITQFLFQHLIINRQSLNDSQFVQFVQHKATKGKDWNHVYQTATREHKDTLLHFEVNKYLELIEPFETRMRDFMLLAGGPSNGFDRYQYLEIIEKEVQDSFLSAFLVREKEALEPKAKRISAELKMEKPGTGINTNFGKLESQYAFGASMYVAQHEDFKSLLEAIQDSFKGKALIVDVWATWCSPCKRDMKNSLQVKKQLAELPVEVVYLCTERGGNTTIWKEIVLEYQTSGTHIWLNEELTKDLIKHYNLRYYPSYYYYSPAGEMNDSLIHHIADIDVEELKRMLQN